MFIDRAKKLYTAGEYKKAQYMYRLFSESYPELANIVNVNKIHCAKKFSEQQLYDNTTEDNIKVSVIVPIYNNYQYLNECINSIREQSLHEIEIILIDDGSTDVRVKNLIKKYAEQDERIVAIYKKNTGYGHTMNVGLSCAKGEFIAIVESDDFISKDMYKHLYTIAKKFDIDIVKSDLNIFYDKEEGRVVHKYNITDSKWYAKKLMPELAIESFDATGFLGTTSAIYSKKLIKKYNIKYNETPGAAYQDIGFWFKTICSADFIYYVDEAFYFIRRDNESSSVHDGKKLEPVRYEYDKLYYYLLTNRHISTKFFSLYMKRKFLSYRWCLNRADESVKNDFLNAFIMDFKEHQMVGTLDTSFFSIKELNELNILLDKFDANKHRFVCIYTATLAHGGLERVACDLSIILKKLGYGVIFILLYDNDFSYDFRGDFIILNLNSEKMKYILEKSYAIFDFKFKKDIPPIEKIVDFCIKNYSNKYIATVHSEKERCRHYFEHIFMAMQKHKVNKIKNVLCVSNAVAKSMKNYYNDIKNISIVYNPIDLKKFENYTFTEVAYDNYILLCSRLNATYVKGIDIALKAFLSSKASDNTKLVCVGNGSIDDSLLDEIKYHKNFSRILFKGFCSEVFSLMRQAKFLISSSRYEGFSMVMLESLACNTPVLTTNVGIANEVIVNGKNGYIVDSNSIELFTKYIDIMNTECEKMSHNFMPYIEKFSFPQYMKSISQILNPHIKISVIIPIYNGEQYLEKCLTSVLAQTISSIEIICIDDGSTDNSKKIILSFNDSRIVYKYQPNQGAGAARNYALTIARGEFISFMDCDDFYPHNNVLKTLYDNAKMTNTKICGGKLYYFDGLQKIPCQDPSFNFTRAEIIRYEDWQLDYGYQLFIYSSSFLKENHIMFPLYRRFQDPPFFVKAMTYSKEFYVCDEYSYVYRSRKIKISWDYQKVFDLLSGIYDNLQFAKKYNFKRLFTVTLSRYEQHSKQIAHIIQSHSTLIDFKNKILTTKF